MSRDFHGTDARAVAELLHSYDGPERERVRLAILDISRGDLGRIRHNVEQAMVDYRDVLAWAEEEGFGDYLGSSSI